MDRQGRYKPIVVLRAVWATENPVCADVWRVLIGLLIGCIVVFHSTGLDARSGRETRTLEKSWVLAENSSSAIPEQECATRFPVFIRELDALLASDPPTIYPVHDLLNEHFPVVACDIHQAIEGARRSRFFAYTAEEKNYYLVVFDSKGLAGRFDPGFHVQINFRKDSGNSWLPSAHVNPHR